MGKICRQISLYQDFEFYQFANFRAYQADESIVIGNGINQIWKALNEEMPTMESDPSSRRTIALSRYLRNFKKIVDHQIFR
eukprot:scaffold378_cov270-Chaetoceros_neogracile.AAC.47